MHDLNSLVEESFGEESESGMATPGPAIAIENVYDRVER